MLSEPETCMGSLPSPSLEPVRSVDFFLRINPARISWLRFILEGYDGLAVLTTLSAQNGLVRVRTLSSGFHQTMRLIASLSPGLTRPNSLSKS